MEDLNFTAQVLHNTGRLSKSLRNLQVLMVICVVVMAVSLLFYKKYTQVYVSVKSGSEITLGWPASMFGIAAFLLFAFVLFRIYLKYRQDLKKPALGLTNQGLFINQQILRNAFVPWDNIERVELRGHASAPVLRIFFKDVDALLKGQPFMLKSFARNSLKPKAGMGISKNEAAGDLAEMYRLILQKGVAGIDQMAGRQKLASGKPGE